jgi:CTP:molybdopterin cytidylyltransferase MocA
MDAVLLAGGIPLPNDPLYVETSGRSKALLDVAGKPMAQWLLDALGASDQIENVLVVGLEPSSGLICKKPLAFLPDDRGLLENILFGLAYVRGHTPDATHILLASTDIPAVTHEIIDWRIEAARKANADLDYVVVERHTMEARFPNSKRSFVRLQDVEVCGGDLNILRVDLSGKTDLWEGLIAARKSARRQVALLGYDLLFRLLTRRITLKQAEQQLSQRLGLNGHVVVSPYAELAMDIDKPSQLAALREDLSAQLRAT